MISNREWETHSTLHPPFPYDSSTVHFSICFVEKVFGFLKSFFPYYDFPFFPLLCKIGMSLNPTFPKGGKANLLALHPCCGQQRAQSFLKNVIKCDLWPEKFASLWDDELETWQNAYLFSITGMRFIARSANNSLKITIKLVIIEVGSCCHSALVLSALQTSLWRYWFCSCLLLVKATLVSGWGPCVEQSFSPGVTNVFSVGARGYTTATILGYFLHKLHRDSWWSHS